MVFWQGFYSVKTPFLKYIKESRWDKIMKPVENFESPPQRKSVHLAWMLVVITAVVSLLYAAQYYLGGPFQLSVVSEFSSLAINPTGKLIAAGANDGSIHVWEVPDSLNTIGGGDFDISQETPWPVHLLSKHNAPVISLAYTHDGASLLSVSGDGEVRRWQDGGLSGAPSEIVLNIGKPILRAAFDSDRSLLAVMTQDHDVQVWDVTTGQLIRTFGSTAGGRAVVLSDDGKLLAASDGVDVQIWSTSDGKLVQRMVAYCDDPTYTTADSCEDADANWLGHMEEVTALAFSPDNQLLTSGSADTTVVFWNVESADVEWSSVGHWAAITSLVFSSDGKRVLSTGADNIVKTLRIPGGKSTATFVGTLAPVNDGLFGPQQGFISSVSDDGTMRVWETINQYEIHLEWSQYGFQPTWGSILVNWLLISGLLGLVCWWGLRQGFLWSHLFTVAVFLVGPILVLGLPFFEVLTYPLQLGVKLQIAWPILVMAIWYIALLIALTREPVSLYYEAPPDAPLAKQLQVSRRILKLRFGIYSLAVWVFLLVLLFSVLRRFNLDVAFMGHYFGFIMRGAWITLYISAMSILLAVVLALLGALGRLSKNPIANGVSGFYISLIRGTPLLVQIFIWYLGLPQLGILLRAEVAGILALGVNYGAYMTEIFRAGIQAIGVGQREAAQALGMSKSQTFRRIVLPQAFRIVIPPIGNEFIAMMKDSSLVYVMGVWELTFRANKIGRQNFRAMETFIIAAAFYWILTVIFQLLQGKLEEYMARGERR
jgi:polar amino acid transport system permease protein